MGLAGRTAERGAVEGLALADVLAARARIASHILHTPHRHDGVLSDRLGVPVGLKCEHQQTTGSFKLRGATNAVLSLDAGQRGAGVVAASTGNHGRALAYASKANGVSATICMSNLVPKNKVEAIRALGAEVVIIGDSQDDAQAEVDRLVSERGMTMVPPFDMAAVIAGQGTLGLEMLEDGPEMSAVLVPLSGGGLMAGVALAIKAMRPEVRVIGVTMDRGAAMHESLLAGKPVAVREVASLADSLGGGIGLLNRHTFGMCKDLVDEVILVTEEEIAEGMRHAYFAMGEVIEGGAAVGIAALLAGKLVATGPVTALLTGRNIDMGLHHRVMGGAHG